KVGISSISCIKVMSNIDVSNIKNISSSIEIGSTSVGVDISNGIEVGGTSVGVLDN
ncbi:13241_t:CDS:1, partial [Dentiscutata erythropus]